jgi:hypothetical protein
MVLTAVKSSVADLDHFDAEPGGSVSAPLYNRKGQSYV